VIRITTHGGEARVVFDYDAEAVAIIRTISGRRWDPDHRYWTIPTTGINLAARRFADIGFTVTVDGRPWTPPAPSPPPARAIGSPVDAFYHCLPPHLREPVYKALLKVLHPDTGGDTRLMQELNASRERHTP
jgi:hypothetical protein